MASLVADYGISSDSDDENEDNSLEKQTKLGAVNFLTSQETNFDTSDHGDDDTNGDYQADRLSLDSDPHSKQQLPNPLNESLPKPDLVNSSDVILQKLPNPLAERLPKPDLVNSSDVKVDSSVFVNRYAIAEEAKLSVLQKHVKMTDHDTLASQGTPKSKSGKQICYNFKKGKCRYGNKCKYFHSDGVLVPSRPDGQCQQQVPNDLKNFKSRNLSNHTEDNDGDSYMSQINVTKKKRAGKTDSLIPPKRALCELSKDRAESRPWTLPN